MKRSTRFKWFVGWGIYCLIIGIWDFVTLRWGLAALMLICAFVPIYLDLNKHMQNTDTLTIIAVPMNITVQRIKDLLCCAIEGGSNYWCETMDRIIQRLRDATRDYADMRKFQQLFINCESGNKPK